MQETAPSPTSLSKLRIAWTTVESVSDAECLATVIMDSHLAACEQIDSPIRSMFHWKGKLDASTEIRLWIKYPDNNEDALQDLVRSHHPYELPQWIAVEATAVAKAYGDWVISTTSG